MKDGIIEKGEPSMSHEKSGRIWDSPVVAHSPSYQQPMEEAEEQTREALDKRKC